MNAPGLPRREENRAVMLTLALVFGYAPTAFMKSSKSARASCGPGAASG